jgi:hypothetical protein
MLEQPDLYSAEDIVCSTLIEFKIEDDKYKLISKVHNSLVGHHGVERTVKRILAKSTVCL